MSQYPYPQQGASEPPKPKSHVKVVLIIVALVVIGIPVLGIVAAVVIPAVLKARESANAAAAAQGDETDKANTMVAEANALKADGMKLKDEAYAKYQEIYKEAMATDDPFEELATLEAPLKEVGTKMETAQGKLRDAAQKIDDAGKLKVDDWFKQYLSAQAESTRKEAEIAGACVQLIKNAYDRAITSEDDLVARNKELGAKIDTLRKEQEAASAKIEKIRTEHKDDLKPVSGTK